MKSDAVAALDSISATEAFDPLHVARYAELFTSATIEKLPQTDREAMHLILLLVRVSSVISFDLEARAQRPSGFSSPGFYLSGILWLAGPLESSRLAAIAGMSRAAVSALAKTLVKHGVLLRSPSPSDGRSVIYSLTPEGTRMIATAFGRVNARESEWASALSRDEQADFVRLLEKVLRGSPAAGSTGDTGALPDPSTASPEV
ncbi:MarR family winged helix-turn-helix transcriptional regulator [Subtercola frigoramans]|uniref:DNA-binding MarR family transcriptional regulator n=1 Tax=Subtercola frigoramans TaxID=120298 RepID=A0ABS2L9N2_9MICO|nr:MarR family winged helix-turn-helix transcriptional regulator [Subtercola frigoramans]MBM7473689.1 DNA-binding MarR family transcriptional regulator [Subtercola frigoramans]